MSIADDVDPDTETETGKSFVEKFSKALRRPPCTPAQFAEQLKKREIRAKEKGVDLFTSGKDQPFVLDKYNKAFAELTHAEKFDFYQMGWGDEEVAHFAEVLVQCKDLKEASPAHILCCSFSVLQQSRTWPRTCGIMKPHMKLTVAQTHLGQLGATCVWSGRFV